MTPIPLARVGAREAFCAPQPPDDQGCTRTCTAPPIPWSGSTTTFAQAELWAQSEACVDAALPPTILCTIALAHDDAWFTAPPVPCKQVHGSGTIDDLRIGLVTRSQDHDIFAYTVEGTMQSIDAAPRTGARVDSEYPRNTEYVMICGVGRSRAPSCTPAFMVAAHDVGGTLERAGWRLSGDLLTLDGFAESSESFAPDAPKGTFRLVFP